MTLKEYKKRVKEVLLEKIGRVDIVEERMKLYENDFEKYFKDELPPETMAFLMVNMF